MSKAFSATRWVLFGTVGFRLVAIFGQMAILRLVEKDVFGAWRQVLSIHLVALLLLPLSLDALVVREKARQNRYVLALTQTLALVGGLCIAGAILWAFLPGPGTESLGARLLGLGQEYPALFFMGPIFFIQSMKLAIRAPLSSRLDFKRISMGEFWNGVITWIGGAAAVIFSPTVWSLMFVYLVGEMFECWWLYRGEPFRPLAALRPGRWRVMTRILAGHKKFCSVNTLDQTFNNLASHLPILLLGAWIATEVAADYAVASQVLVLPVMLLVGAIWRVAFPSLSGVPEEELQRRCLRIVGSGAAFIAPWVIWFAAFAPTTIWVLAGPDYLNVASYVRWIALFMLGTSVFSPISSIDMIRDRPELGLYWNICYFLGRIGALWYFARYGAEAAIMGFSIFSAVFWVVWIWVLGWLVGCGWRRFLGSFSRFVPLWVLLGGAAWWIIEATDGHLIWGPVLSIVPGGIYLLVVLRFFPKEADMFWKMAGLRRSKNED